MGEVRLGAANRLPDLRNEKGMFMLSGKFCPKTRGWFCFQHSLKPNKFKAAGKTR